jgi:hypothetical protein
MLLNQYSEARESEQRRVALLSQRCGDYGKRKGWGTATAINDLIAVRPPRPAYCGTKANKDPRRKPVGIFFSVTLS